MASIQLTETAQGSIATPSSGKDQLFFDSADGGVKAKNASGNFRLVDNTGFRLYHEIGGSIGASVAAGTYQPNQNGVTTATSAGTAIVPTTYLDSTLLGATGFKMRLFFQVLTNNVAPGTITFTAGLYRITANSGTAGGWIPTLGTVVTGSTAAVVNPAASTPAQNNSGDFTTSATNFVDQSHYMIAVVTSASTAANTNTKWAAQLAIRNI